MDRVFGPYPRDLSLIQELGIRLVACLDTDAHADHVAGSWLMHEATGGTIGLAAAAKAENVTTPLEHGDRVSVGSRNLEVRATPGHTNGCVSFVLDDQSIAQALPVNLRSGKSRQQQPAPPAWGPVQRSFAGLPELTLLDVRSQQEVKGPDGRAAQSLLIPLPRRQPLA